MEDNLVDAAHDKLHAYRVLNQSLSIAKSYSGINYDVLVASCLLHDIGRASQFCDPTLCHAQVGGKMAYDFLSAIGWDTDLCEQVKHCIETHRYRNEQPPASIEAKILFDADKLDVTGAIGIARTLLYKGRMNEPMYVVDKCKSCVFTKDSDQPESFIKEYNYKLIKVYDMFFTEAAKDIAQKRKEITSYFYDVMLEQISTNELASFCEMLQ